MSEVSNCLIINGKRVKIPQEMIDKGYTAKNYLDDEDVPKFRSKKRWAKVRHFVLHETCGNTAKGCERTFIRKGYGVQLIQDPDGNFTCHGDLVRDRMVHANQLNNGSFGVEQVNPYSPVFVTDKEIFGKWTPKRWWTWIPRGKYIVKALKRKGWKKAPKQYVELTDKQIESMAMFAEFVCVATGVPYSLSITGWRKKKWPKSGVVAHRSFSNHADGQFMIEHLRKLEE